MVTALSMELGTALPADVGTTLYMDLGTNLSMNVGAALPVDLGTTLPMGVGPVLSSLAMFLLVWLVGHTSLLTSRTLYRCHNYYGKQTQIPPAAPGWWEGQLPLASWIPASPSQYSHQVRQISMLFQFLCLITWIKVS